MKRRINLVLLAILFAASGLLGGGIYLVHGVQMRRNASALLTRADQADASKDLTLAEESLKIYLSLRRDDGPAWKRYAQIQDKKNTDPRSREQVFLVHEQALRFNPGDAILERRCADLAMELGRYHDARRNLSLLLGKLPRDPQGRPVARDPAESAKLAELEDLLGQCDRGLNRYEDAEKWFLASLQHDPGRIACYARLARLRRAELRRAAAADSTIQEMITKNPKAGLAYINRWRYFQEFSLPGDEKDIQEGLKLAPDDPEVLFTAAVASERMPDAASARIYWEKGRKLDPTNIAFALGLSRLEARENHLDRAEAVLRQTYEANRSLDVAFELADNLILQDKIDGKAQAREYLASLRDAGFGDTYVAYLEARILFKRDQWSEAIPAIQSVRIALNSDSRLTAQLDLMLAECYGRVGHDDQRLDALRRAADDGRGPEPSRIAYAKALGQTGKLDQALAILVPMAERQPELKTEIIGLLIRKTLKLPPAQRRWLEVEKGLQEAEAGLPGKIEDLTVVRADLLELQGKADAARQFLEKYIRRNPKSIVSRVSLAALLQRGNDTTQAQKVLDSAEKELGRSPALLRARLSFWSLRGGEEAKKAIHELAEARSGIPVADQPGYLDELATAFYRLGDAGRTSQLLEELSKLQPKNVELLSRRAELAISARDQAAVEDLVGQVKRIEGERGTLWRYIKAGYLIGEASRGDATTSEAARKAARILVEEIFAHRGDWWGGLVLRGRLAELKSNPEDAVRDYLHAIELGANQPAVARRLFVLLHQRQQFDQIDQVVQKLADRGMAPNELTLATALNALRRREFERAVSVTQAVIPADSRSAPDLLILSRILMAAGRTEDAEKPLNRAVELAPGDPDVWVSKVQFLTEADRKQEIPKVLDQAARALPAEQATMTLAVCHATAGNHELATKLFESMLDVHPNDPRTLRLAAGHYIKVLKFEKAEPLLARLLDPKTKASATTVAWARRSECLNLMKSGDQHEVDKALALVDQNLKDYQYNFEDRRARAIVLSMKADRRAEAIRELEALDRSRLLTVADRFLLAQLYRGNREWPKCQAQMLGLVKERKPEPNHIVYFVNLLLEQGQLDQAEHWLAELKPVGPSLRTAYVDLKSRLLKARHQDSDVLPLLREYSRSNADQVGAVADLLERYGFLEHAEQAFRSYVAENTKEPLRVLALARFLGRHDRVPEALGLCEGAWKTCPPEPVAAASLAILSSGKGGTDQQRSQVESWLEDAEKRQSSSNQIRLALAALRKIQRRYDQTESIYRAVLSASSNNLEALNNLAWLLAFQAGKESEALDLINRAIAIAGTNPTLFDTRAVIYLQLGKTDLAIQDLRAAVGLNSEKPVLYFHLARALEMDGNAEQARQSFRAAEGRGLKVETIDPLERQTFLKIRQKLSRS